MKIGPSNALPSFAREPAKASKTTGAGESKPVPPGLERVQARMQSVPAADRNAGQATALDRISRNIARYAETQAIVPPPPATVPVTPPVVADSATTAPVDTTPATPVPAASATVEGTDSNGIATQTT